MSMFKVNENKEYSSAFLIAQRAFKQCGFICKNIVQESESQDYDAYEFEINNLRIKFRVAKITPTKIGQFVTLWKRKEKNSPILPFDNLDLIDLVVVSVRSDNNFGQFVFPKSLLIEKGIISQDEKGGKRAMRVYPPWDVPESSIAQKTQAWQLPYYFEIEPKLDFLRAQGLLSYNL